MGELEFEQKALAKAVDSAIEVQERAADELRLATPGGLFHLRWDENGSATALGQLAFFAEFLEVSGVFDRWLSDVLHQSQRTGSCRHPWHLAAIDPRWTAALCARRGITG